ncbi:MAG: TolC family protein [Gammaproteobacteria bacterium]|nr:TolC family protein [Gammaproteobacteria bacterium]
MWKLFARQLGICLFMVLSGTIVRAESGLLGDGQMIGLKEAVARTLARNPELIAFGYQLQAQDARVVQAGLAPNPELSLTIENALGTGEFTGMDGAETTLSIAWVLEHSVRQRRLETARAGVSLLDAEADILRLDAAAETARLFFLCLFNQTQMVNAGEAVQLAQETVSAVKKRVQAGKSPQAELARARAELARLKLDLEDFEHELLSASRRLAAQWGETEPDFKRVNGELVSLPNTDSFETLKTRIVRNPDIARFLSKQRVDEAELRLAEAQRKQNWRVSAGVRRLEITDDEALVANLTIPLTLRNRNQGGIAEARAKMAQTEADAVAARIRIETSLFVIYQELQHSLHRAKTFRDHIIPQLEQALADTRNAYDLGRYSYIEWRTAQKDLLEAHRALVEASVDAHNNTIEIERLTGVRIAQPTISP